MVLAAGAGRGGGGEAKEQGGERRRARGGGRRCGSRRGKGWLRASLTPQLRPGPGLRLRVRRRRRRRKIRRRRRKDGAGRPQAALDAARSGRPRRGAARTARIGRSGAQGRRAGRRSALPSRTSRPPPALLLRPRLRSARSLASDVMRGPRRCGAEGRQSTHPDPALGRERVAPPCLQEATESDPLSLPLCVCLPHSTSLLNAENDVKLSRDICFWSSNLDVTPSFSPCDTDTHSAQPSERVKRKEVGAGGR